ncbi:MULTISPECIES: PTS sugar transporter subunit IIC [Erysipelotrichaceae]|jgi:ascorbate PTS system EIIC component|uniref:PTS sugar transporter subunit IIC n=1 Tax=Erysipelotrichaceae TaxID=128827 RepID=UPI000E3EECAC|nr:MULTISPECIES: PTS sugar transporter subunit IIC [unclassified Absiella]RGB64951.1 PTS sugar transporter subunit IIC [Absiella sp. AM09-45]RGB74143.1 PTS sugar transporter subunit IIC [Absiella sp. AM09-50]RGC23160.1 PTS sugar transporter subunit IIC [Absiella sp. AM54-8XD]RGC51871.1 PTS sugar transporter subunit IIC [Absiella sp. AM29-15]
MSGFFKFLVNDFLTEPVILIGLLICIGYILNKEKPVKIITGTISAMVGIQMVIFGGTQFSNIFKPITTAVANSFGIQGYIMDSYAMKSTTQEALGNAFGLVGYVFLIAFAVNLLLVWLGKYTKAKGVFLTGNAGIAHSQAILWLVIAVLGVSGSTAVIISGILVGIYWAFSTTLAYKTIDDVTGGAGFTVGHNQQIGIWFFGKIAKFFGNPEQDAENLKLPGWLSIFNNNVTSVALIMAVFVGAFMSPLGISGIQELAGKQHWFNFIILTGINFSMDMVILLTGVRMMCGELTGAFKGIQEKLVPNAVPAIDVAAMLPFSPNAATLGFIFTTIGTVLAMLILLATHSTVMVLPGFTPLFFSGGPIGIVANKYGGVKSIIVCSILLGFIQTFGTIWAIHLMMYPQGAGWSGMFDFSTFWPAVTEVMKFIGNLF